MKTFRNIIIVSIIVTAFACNNQPLKQTEKDTPAIKIQNHDTVIVKPKNKTKGNKLKTCKYIVTMILTTSPRYKQLVKGLNEAVVKNGGLNFGVGLEGSPNPKRDSVCCYSSNYDFSVYESYTDRQLSTARFSFNPNDKQLYEYDAVQDQLKPIEFDRNLLIKYKSLCE